MTLAGLCLTRAARTIAARATLRDPAAPAAEVEDAARWLAQCPRWEDRTLGREVLRAAGWRE